MREEAAQRLPSFARKTSVSFKVKEIGAAIKSLKATSVIFEDYDSTGLKTISHAWVLQ